MVTPGSGTEWGRQSSGAEPTGTPITPLYRRDNVPGPGPARPNSPRGPPAPAPEQHARDGEVREAADAPRHQLQLGVRHCCVRACLRASGELGGSAPARGGAYPGRNDERGPRSPVGSPVFHLLGAIEFKTPVYFLYPELMASLPQGHSAGAEVRVTADGIWRLRKPRRALRGIVAPFGPPREHRQVLRTILARTPGRGGCSLAPPSSRHAPASAPFLPSWRVSPDLRHRTRGCWRT